MFDSDWCDSLLSQLKESRWHAFRVADDFSETLDDARSVWHDSAGREVDRRFLIPHDDELHTMRTTIETHSKSLDQSIVHMRQGADIISDIGENSTRVREEIVAIESDIEELYSRFEIASRACADASSKIAEARQILATI